MRKFLALLICLELILFPVHSVAAEASTKTETAVPDEKTTKQYGQAAPDAGTNPVYDSQSQSKGGYDFYAKQILAISTSIIGTNIIEQCSFGLKIPSIATFMAGSLVYILSEFAGAKAQNENHNRRIEDIKLTEEKLKSQGGEVQKELITQRYKEEVANKEYLESRNKWMMAVTAIYWTAMGLAIMEETSGVAAATAAGTATCAQVAHKLSKPCGKAYAACYAAHFPACLGTMPIGWASTKPNFANPAAYSIAKSTCAGAGPYVQGCLTHTNTYHGIAWANCQPFTAGGGIKGWLMAKAVTMAYSAGLTRNSGSPVTKYIVMLSGLLEFMVPSLQKLTMASYNYPIPRSVTFAVSAALATAITAGLNQRIAVAKENIKKMDKVLTQYKIETDDDTVIEHDKVKEDDQSKQDAMNSDYQMKLAKTSFSTGDSNAVKRLPETKVASKTTQKKTCFSQNGDNVEYSEKACSNPMQISAARFGTDKNQVLADASKLSTDMAQALTEGNTAKAEVIAGELNNMLGKIKSATQSLQDEKDRMMESEGVDPDDFHKSVSERVALLVDEVNKAAKEKNIDLTPDERISITNEATFAALGAGMSSEKGAGKNQDAVVAPTVVSGVHKTIGTASPQASGLNDFMNGIEDGADSSLVTDDNPYGLSPEALRAARANGYMEVGRRLKEQKSNDDGISTLTDASIFKQLSHRYFLNYPRFFNRQEIPASSSK